MSDELKPCPFCKSGCLYETQRNGYCDYTAVMFCNRCKAIVTWEQVEEEGVNEKTRQFVREHWNTRADDADEPPLDRLLRCLENDYGILAEWDGLRRVWYIQRAEPLPVDNAQADSRERLEADVRSLFKYQTLSADLSNYVIEFLDRQEAITRAEVFKDGEFDCMTCGAKRELQERVDSLTAERDELQSIIDHMPKTEQECEACQDAHDRLMFNCKVDMDKLRDELKHKQLVIDRQRDSFAKMEREYRELQDVCGELERTVENMRGME